MLTRLNSAGPAPTATPNDPAYNSGPGPQWNLPIIKAPEAWALPCPDPSGGPDVPCTGNHSVIIAVADSGAAIDNPDLQPNIWSGQSSGDHDWYNPGADNDVSDGFGHGTSVASIIGAKGNNGIGMTGVAWDVSLMILKFTGAAGLTRGEGNENIQASSSDISSMIDYAHTHNATALNLSAGEEYSTSEPGSSPIPDIDPNVEAAILRARKNKNDPNTQSGSSEGGMLIVNSAGNKSRNLDVISKQAPPLSPTHVTSDNLIVVGATNKDDTRACYSNWGSYVHLGAPGGRV